MASSSIFSDEIMTEILLKLPVKSILRCNTLSKHYYSLIHSKTFTRRHLALGRLNDKLYDQSIVNPIQDSVRLFNRRGDITVLQVPLPIAEESSSDGLGPVACGPVEGLYWVIDINNERYAVWNPSTREQLILPRVPPTCDNGENSSQLGATRVCIAYGFGYDDATDDYKFVLIYAFISDIFTGDDAVPRNGNRFNIFSVSKGEWRSTNKRSGVFSLGFSSPVGVFVHGACHWLYSPTHDPGTRIIAIDMVIESHRFINVPITEDDYIWSEVCIAAFNGCLGLINQQRGENMIKGLCSSFDVWVMAEYGVEQSWMILYQVSLPDGICGRFSGIVRDRLYIVEGDGCLVSYDLYTKDEKRYGILDDSFHSKGCMLMPYEKSLVRISNSV